MPRVMYHFAGDAVRCSYSNRCRHFDGLFFFVHIFHVFREISWFISFTKRIIAFGHKVLLQVCLIPACLERECALWLAALGEFIVVMFESPCDMI